MTTINDGDSPWDQVVSRVLHFFETLQEESVEIVANKTFVGGLGGATRWVGKSKFSQGNNAIQSLRKGFCDKVFRISE